MRVLFVDDNPLVLEVMKRVLSLTPNVSIAVTKRVAEAIATIEELGANVIVSNLKMPAVNQYRQGGDRKEVS